MTTWRWKMNLKIVKRTWEFLNSKIVFAVMIVAAIVLAPTRARSQFVDPCCAIITAGLDTISGLLENGVPAPLSSIQQIQQQGPDHEQTLGWPQAAIGQAPGKGVPPPGPLP